MKISASCALYSLCNMFYTRNSKTNDPPDVIFELKSRKPTAVRRPHVLTPIFYLFCTFIELWLKLSADLIILCEFPAARKPRIELSIPLAWSAKELFWFIYDLCVILQLLLCIRKKAIEHRCWFTFAGMTHHFPTINVCTSTHPHALMQNRLICFDRMIRNKQKRLNLYWQLPLRCSYE